MARNVQLPNGQVVEEVPDEFSQKDLADLLLTNGEIDQAMHDQLLSTGPETKPDNIAVQTVKNVAGGWEAAAGIFASGLAEVPIGLGGIFDAGIRSLRAPFSKEQTVKGSIMEAATDMKTARELVGRATSPRSEAGKKQYETIGEWLAPIEAWADQFAESKFERPSAQATAKAIILGLPSALGMKAPIKNFFTRRQAFAEIESRARDLGIDFGSRDLRNQIQAAGEGRVFETRGGGMEEVRTQLADLRAANKQHVDDLYKDARATYAEVDGAAAQELSSRVADRLAAENIDLRSPIMNDINRWIKDLEVEALSEGGSHAVLINDVERVRRLVSGHKSNDPGVIRARTIMKKEMDAWLDDTLNRDLIRGDEGALQAWKDARAANTAYQQRFNADKVIHKLTTDFTATPETMRKWIFGAGKSGFNTQAAHLVNRLKELLGEDSPQFQALRMEAAYNIMEPLAPGGVGNPPNLPAFVLRYDNFVKNNLSAMKALGLDTEELAFLRNTAEAAVTTGAAPLTEIDLVRSGVQLAFGNMLSRNAMFVRNATSLVKRSLGIGQSERHAMLMELADIDIESPMITGPAMSAVLISLARSEGMFNEEQ